jgi:hypothetical protein
MMQLRSEIVHLVPQNARHDCHPQHWQEVCAVEIPNHRLRAQRCNVRLLQCQARQRQCQCRDACRKISVTTVDGNRCKSDATVWQLPPCMMAPSGSGG